LGFLGIEKDYVCKEILIPHKKPRKQELSPAQKAENQVLASQRIVVEHAHAGLKRYRILVDRLRMHDFALYDIVLGVCAGLWNFYLSGLSHKFLYFFIVPLQLLAGVRGCELPLHGRLCLIPLLSPEQHCAAQRLDLRDPAIQALLGKCRKFNLRHVEPRAFLGRVVGLEPLR
jgi:hypothetical protein